MPIDLTSYLITIRHQNKRIQAKRVENQNETLPDFQENVKGCPSDAIRTDPAAFGTDPNGANQTACEHRKAKQGSASP